MGAKIRAGAKFFVNGKDGGVASGWKVETFDAGSAGVLGSDNKETFTDYTLGTAQTNPIILNERGEAEVWWNGTYLIKVYDENDVLIYSMDYFGQGEDTEADSEAVPLNGSFETDLNADGTPDNWALTPGTNGTIATDTADSAKGLTSLKFTGTDATGGGVATSDKFDVEKNDLVTIGYTYISSAVDTLNKIDINWYDAADALLSTDSLLSEGAANPTSWTTGTASATVPATAVRAEIVLTGVDGTGTTNAGSTWFDNITYLTRLINGDIGGTAILDEDDMASDSAVKLATQQSIKKYAESLPVFLGTTIALTAGSTTKNVWADVTDAVLSDNKARAAIVRFNTQVSESRAPGSGVDLVVYVSKDETVGGTAKNDKEIVSLDFTTNSGAAADVIYASCSGEITIPLSATFDFSILNLMNAGSAFNSERLTLIGYYK